MLQTVEFNEVQVNDLFWNRKIETIQQVTLPLLLDIAEEQGKIDNFRITAGKKKGKIRLYNAPDSDVYKLLEAAGYLASFGSDSILEARCDAIIEDIIDAQDTSGYINTQYTLDFDHPASPSRNDPHVLKFGYGPENRWCSRSDNWPFAYSQLYCAGHLFESAVAYYRGTGKRRYLDAAIRFADHICDVFTFDKISTYADHPQLEIGLMKLYEVTKEEKYFHLADWSARYIKFTRPVDLNQEENSKPLHRQSKAYGHCVRTAYVYSGATDVVRATGEDSLKRGLSHLWENVTTHKMYIHGGTGNGVPAEQHGEDDDLPIFSTYSECCANIAQGQWNHRLNLLTADAKYADLVELELYNGGLAGISDDGKRFFYANKINISEKNRETPHNGLRTTYLFCCPSKLPGFITGVGRWIYAKDDKGIYVNQYIGSTLKTRVSGNEIRLNMKSDYVWNGKVEIEIGSEGEFECHLRIPSRVAGSNHISSTYSFSNAENPEFSLFINGEEQKANNIRNGYLSIQRRWNRHDKIELLFEMPVMKIYTDPDIKANQGRVALMRGPLLYCLEGCDHPFDILQMQLSADDAITSVFEPDMLGGAMVLKGKGLIGSDPVVFKAIPYFGWQNRGVSSMCMLLIEDREKAGTEETELIEKVNTNG
jgi:DUF1680 family protein